MQSVERLQAMARLFYGYSSYVLSKEFIQNRRREVVSEARWKHYEDLPSVARRFTRKRTTSRKTK